AADAKRRSIARASRRLALTRPGWKRAAAGWACSLESVCRTAGGASCQTTLLLLPSDKQPHGAAGQLAAVDAGRTPRVGPHAEVGGGHGSAVGGAHGGLRGAGLFPLAEAGTRRLPSWAQLPDSLPR